MQETGIETKRKHKLELIAIIGLGIATFFNAFTAFQSSQHSGAMNYLYTRVTSLANEITTMYMISQSQSFNDQNIYMRLIELEESWQAAPEGSDARERAEKSYLDYRMRFVHEDLDAAIAWSNEHYADTNEYISPWESPAYQEEMFRVIAQVTDIAERTASEGDKHNAVSDHMLLISVFYTTVMFLLGICGTLKNWKHKVTVLFFAGALFAAATVLLVQQPFFPDAEKTHMDILADFLAQYPGE